jgi:hypothetical protein
MRQAKFLIGPFKKISIVLLKLQKSFVHLILVEYFGFLLTLYLFNQLSNLYFDYLKDECIK